MFGCFRLILAVLVIFDHLGPTERVGPAAVFGFYVLSGYLMTFVMQEVYGYSPSGMLRFAANRWLRIFPIYLLACVATLILVAAIGESVTRSYHRAIGWPHTLEDAWRNAFLILTIDTTTRLVPPAWALTIELTFYLAIGLGLSRYYSVTLAWVGASLAYTIYLVLGDASFAYRYFTVSASSLPFALGALVYHLRARRSTSHVLFTSRVATAAVAVLLFTNIAFIPTASKSAAEGMHFYVNLVLVVILVAQLASQREKRLAKIDHAMGNYSYPVYLLHYQAGLVVVLSGNSSGRGATEFLLAALPVVFLLAWLAVHTVDPIIEGIRSRVRNSKAGHGERQAAP